MFIDAISASHYYLCTCKRPYKRPQLCNIPMNAIISDIHTTKDCGQQWCTNVNHRLMLTLKEMILVFVSSQLDDS